jgi:hypothetical protein
MAMLTRRHFWQFLVGCFILVGSWQTAFAGGKSCGRCGSHKELKTVYRLVKTCQEIDMPQYAETKQEAFFPDKGAVCYPGYRCDTFHTLWRNCDCTISCQSHTICGCKTHYGAKSTGHQAGCAVRQPFMVSRLTVPVIKWEVVHRCKNCGDDGGKGSKK